MGWEAEYSDGSFRAWDYYSETLRKYVTTLDNYKTSIVDFQFLDAVLNFIEKNENEGRHLTETIKKAKPCITVGRNGVNTRVIDMKVLVRDFSELDTLHKVVEIQGIELDIRDLYSLLWYLLTNTDLAATNDPRITFLEELGVALEEKMEKRPQGFSAPIERVQANKQDIIAGLVVVVLVIVLLATMYLKKAYMVN